MEENERDLHEEYEVKANEMKEKYHAAIVAIAEKQGVDMGVAFDMLRAVARGGNYAEGIDLDTEALKADVEELTRISDELRIAKGLALAPEGVEEVTEEVSGEEAPAESAE